jgi:hypothetical protein
LEGWKAGRLEGCKLTLCDSPLPAFSHSILFAKSTPEKNFGVLPRSAMLCHEMTASSMGFGRAWQSMAEPWQSIRILK